jgi:L-fuconolactonase
MIIDTHTHFYDPSRPQGVPWPSADNELLYRTVLPEHFRKVAEPCGVTGTVVVEASAWLEDNQWVLDLAAKEPFIVGLVGHVDPGEGFGEHIGRFAENPLFRGIRCGSGYFQDVGQGSFLEDVEKLIGKDLELDVLISKQQFGGLFELARRLPELRIVINHIAHVPIDGNLPDREWLDGIQQAAEFPGIWMKVSAVLEQSKVQPAPADAELYAPTLEAMWEAFGEDRLVYGSNWPVCERAGDFATAFGVVRDFFAGKGEEAREKYFWKNAKAAYKWVDRS